MEVLVDTSAIAATLNKKDDHHQHARETLQTARDRDDRLFVTNFLVAETYGLVNVRLGARHARAWLRENTMPVERVTPEDEERAEEILLDHDDKAYSYVDATSFAVMERLGVDVAFEFDEDFEQFGWRSLAAER